MLKNKDNYYCRVCGFQYDEPVWTSETHGSHDICICCECEFGYDDISILAIREYRKQWLEEKKAQWSVNVLKPENWSLEDQLRQIPKKYR